MTQETNALAGATLAVNPNKQPYQTAAAVARTPSVTNPTPGQTQRDGTPTNLGVKPTKAGLETRAASPKASNASGIEKALGALADKTHPVKMRAGR